MNPETKIAINLAFQVQFGGTLHEIKKLPIGRSEAWRAKAAKLDRERLEATEKSAEGLAGDLAQSVKTNEVIFNQNPKYVTELVLEYCAGQGPLTRDWLLLNATDEEIAAAFAQILGTVLPLELLMGGKETMRKVMTVVPSTP